jgi:hypothetical protein
MALVMTGAIGVVAQSQQFGQTGHGGVRMLVIDRISIFPVNGANCVGGPRSCARMAALGGGSVLKGQFLVLITDN